MSEDIDTCPSFATTPTASCWFCPTTPPCCHYLPSMRQGPTKHQLEQDAKTWRCAGGCDGTQTGSAPRLDNSKFHPLSSFSSGMTCEIASCLPGHDLHCLPIALLLRGTGTGRLKKTPDAEQESATTNKLLHRGEKQHIPRVFPRLSFTQYGRASEDTDVLN